MSDQPEMNQKSNQSEEQLPQRLPAVQAKLNELNALIEIIYPEASDEKAIRNTLRSYAAKTIAPDLVSIERREQVYTNIWLALGGLLSCPAIIIAANMDRPQSHEDWQTIAAAAVISWFVWLVVIVIITLLSSKYLKYLLFISTLVPLITRAFIVALNWKPRTPLEFVLLGVCEGVLVVSCFFITFYSLLAVRKALVRAYERRVRRKSPIAYLLYLLFRTLEQRLSRLTAAMLPPSRERLISLLEDAAECVESVPRILFVRDPSLALWTKIVYKQRANGILALRKWILMPKADTPQSLEKEVKRIIANVVAGDWDGLPAVHRDHLSVVRWWEIALQTLRGITVIAIPPLVVGALNIWPQGWMTPQIRDYMISVAFIWVLVSVLSILDPKLADKLSLIKKVKDALSPDSKGSD